MLRADEYEVFSCAENLEILNQLWAWAKDLGQTDEMLRAGEYMAFKIAARDGHQDILNQLWTWASDDQKIEIRQTFNFVANTQHVALI